MDEISVITEFLGWCSIINIVLLTLTAVFVVFFRGCIVNIHSKMFGLDKEKLPLLYFRYLANYKIAIIVFNIVPYIAFKIMG